MTPPSLASPNSFTSFSMSLRLLTALGGGKLGGAEAYFVSLNLALKRRGVDTRAVIRENKVHLADLRAGSVPVDLAHFGGPLDIFTKPKLARIARGFKPDIVLTFAARASHHMPKGDYTLVGRLGGYYKLKHFEKCDYLFCNAPDLVRHCVEGGWPASRVRLIPNFPRIDEDEAVSRASLATPEGVPVALAMGRLHPNKAQDVLLRAAAQVPDLHVWIAGEGEERSNLERLARDLGIQSRVRFLGWRTDRAGLFKAATFCAFPSREEPFGNVVVEAWAYGAPLIAAASTGPAWLVRNGEDGLLVPVDDDAALAAAMREIIADPEKARRLAANGVRRVAGEFSEQAVVDTYLDFFQNIRAKA
jgi:glycosyltransferase involved in cell wall biosynthesis